MKHAPAIVLATTVLLGNQASAARKIYANTYDTGSWNIVRMNEDGTNLEQVVTGSADEYGFDVSADGRYMVYNSNVSGSFQLYKLDLFTNAFQQMTFTDQNTFARWSPDGSKIMFTKQLSLGGFGEIFVMNADGSSPVNLTNSAGTHDAIGEWSPNGQNIAFSRGTPNGGIDIYTMSSAGTGLTQISSLGWDEYQVSWNSSGTQFAFHGLSGGNWEIMRCNADGSGLTNLTNIGGADQGPYWTPEGQILFTSQRFQDSLYRMNSDGTNVQLVRAGFFSSPRLENAVVPEPGTIAALGIAGIFFRRVRKQKIS